MTSMIEQARPADCREWEWRHAARAVHGHVYSSRVHKKEERDPAMGLFGCRAHTRRVHRAVQDSAPGSDHEAQQLGSNGRQALGAIWNGHFGVLRIVDDETRAVRSSGRGVDPQRPWG